jgi:hypothetical protein
MARPSKEERLSKVHAEARAMFMRVWSSSQETRKQCQEDRRFAGIPGGQWEGRLGEQFENKPKPEVNKVQIALMRIYSEYRNNRIAADFVPKDGSTDQDLADVCDGLYRSDEQDSCAEESYDNAFDEGVTGGIGAWRLRAEYENPLDDEDERQRIRFEPIFDADSSVFFDTDARRFDKSDAKRCWVIYAQEREAYVDEWGDDPASWPKDTEYSEFDWCTPDLVYLAEYYVVEDKPHTVHVLVGLDKNEVRYTDEELMEAAEVDDVESALGVMTLQGFVKLREKRVKKRRVHKYIMSGGRVLEDCGYIAGPNIPIVVFYGKRWVIDGVERCQGHVRLAKDPQRIKNMQYAKLMELAALSSTQKPIMTPEQVMGHQVMWAEDNVKDYPYLLINPVTTPDGQKSPQGPVGSTQPPQIPPALAALLQQSEADMMDILGRPQDGQEVVSNMSGKAVELIQQRLDMQAFLYMSNFAKAMRRSGEIWLGMAKEVYVEAERKMKMLGELMNIESVTLAEPVIVDGELTTRNDLSRADFDVTVDVGPSFASKRDATVRALTGILQMVTDPAEAKILQSLILMNMEGEGLSQVNEYYRKQLVGMGVIPPNEEEQEAIEKAASQKQQPDPQELFLASEAAKNDSVARLNEAKALEIAAKVDKAVAETENVDADTGLKQADTVKREAETLEILRGEPPAP